MPRNPAANTFAGYNDYVKLSGQRTSPSAWLPTPVAWPASPIPRRAEPVRKVGFLGNMNYPPNAMSLRKFIADHSENLKRLDMELVVAGYGSEIVETWTNQATVVGPVDEVSEFYSSVDAVIVPIDHGGGIKVKAVEAMVHGVPVYGTKHVREGFDSSFWPYIGDLHALLNGTVTDVDTAPPASLEARFSEDSFRAGVADLLSRLGNQRIG